MSFFRAGGLVTAKHWILCFCFIFNTHYALADEAADMVHHGGVLAKLGNFQGAEQWYKKAVTNGSIEANYLLAVMAIRGYVRQSNVTQAIKYYTLAADKGHVKAQYELSVIYSNKKLNLIDHEKHLYWLKKAAANNHIIAIHNLATIAVRVKKYATAIHLFTKAKESDYAPSILSLANMYYYGLGTKKDYQKAFTLLQSAYTKGEKTAALQLGILYERGLGVEKDNNEAKKLYRFAVDEGDVSAGFNLAILMIEEGNKTDALKIMTKVATAGDKRAKKYLQQER